VGEVALPPGRPLEKERIGHDDLRLHEVTKEAAERGELTGHRSSGEPPLVEDEEVLPHVDLRHRAGVADGDDGKRGAGPESDAVTAAVTGTLTATESETDFGNGDAVLSLR